MRVLTVRGLAAGYDGVAVVRDLDLHVDAGEVLALVGPNGAGKTTTLLTLSGLLEPLAGDVELVGEGPPARGRPHRTARRGVAHVPEDRGVLHGLTVRENLRLGAAGADGVDGAVELFPALGPLLGRAVGLLSGGEQQMLAVARALVGSPRLLLLDELSLGLAPIIVEQLLPAVRAFADRDDAGVVLVEQHVPMALTIADRACVLSHGEVLMAGSADELRRHPELVRSGYLGTAPSGADRRD